MTRSIHNQWWDRANRFAHKVASTRRGEKLSGRKFHTWLTVMYAQRELEDHSQDKSAQIEFIIPSRNICNASSELRWFWRAAKSPSTTCDFRDSAFQIGAHHWLDPLQSTVASTYRYLSIDDQLILSLCYCCWYSHTATWSSLLIARSEPYNLRSDYAPLRKHVANYQDSRHRDCKDCRCDHTILRSIYDPFDETTHMIDQCTIDELWQNCRFTLHHLWR